MSIIQRKELWLCVLPPNSHVTVINCIALVTRKEVTKCVLVVLGRRLSGWVGAWDVGLLLCHRSMFRGVKHHYDNFPRLISISVP